jgi:hypothetical protein
MGSVVVSLVSISTVELLSLMWSVSQEIRRKSTIENENNLSIFGIE